MLAATLRLPHAKTGFIETEQRLRVRVNGKSRSARTVPTRHPEYGLQLKNIHALINLHCIAVSVPLSYF
jgi:hypothetical protein